MRRMLLLLILCSCVSATFVVNVSQSSYQAEENHNITLEWTFTATPETSSRDLFIICNLKFEEKLPIVYRVFIGVERPEDQDEQFSGRVQSDKDVLREGRIRLLISRLKMNDSGWYLCYVTTDSGSGSRQLHLNVTEENKTKCEETPGATSAAGRKSFESQKQIVIPIVSVAGFLVVVCLFVLYFVGPKKEKLYLKENSNDFQEESILQQKRELIV